jgi:hypothetical protein
VTLWDNIETLVNKGIIVTCSEIEKEVNEDDDLNKWVNNNSCVVLQVDDNDIQNLVSEIVNKFPKLIGFKNNKSSADAFLIATAIKYNLSIITEESKTSPNKIPKICAEYNIFCYNLTELAEQEQWQF